MLDNKIKKNVDLTPYNTFRLSALAEYFIIVENREELIAALRWARERKLPTHFLGGGSNLLIKNKKIKGLVVKIGIEGVKLSGRTLVFGAGLLLSEATRIALAKGLSGLEWATGIPGTVGGAVRGNAGAFNKDIGQAIMMVKAINLKTLTDKTFNKKQSNFSYRDSIFKTKKDLIIYEVKLSLKVGKKIMIKQQMVKFLKHRLATQPQLPSAGSVFKNINAVDLFKTNRSAYALAEKQAMINKGKISAGWLIDQLKLRGRTVGKAKVSDKHANFIVNSTQAKAGDVITLIKFIKQQVKKNYHIDLEEEIQYFGD